MLLISRVNCILDKSCSLFVGATVALVDAYCVLHYNDAILVPVFTSGACLTAGLSKCLKRVINQSRPPGAPKLSPGMPSNHATSLAYLGVSAVYALQRYKESMLTPGYTSTRAWAAFPVPTVPDIPARYIGLLQTSIITYSVYLTALRVTQGHHTMAQVVVGYSFGASCALLSLAANYAGYTGSSPGGRVDELSKSMKMVDVAASTLLALVTARSIYRGAVHGRRSGPVSHAA